jgi:hypothetical protein
MHRRIDRDESDVNRVQENGEKQVLRESSPKGARKEPCVLVDRQIGNDKFALPEEL